MNLPEPIDIGAALKLLHDTYPHERVQITATVNEKTYSAENPRHGLQFHAWVGDSHEGWVYGDSNNSAIEAADALIAKAGKRDPITQHKQALEKAKAEVEKAEAALKELEAKQPVPF